MEVSGQFHVPAALKPRKERPVPEGWVGPRVCLDTVKKRKIPCPCRPSNHGLPARRYTGWDIKKGIILKWILKK
jgi:hypothetical protein